MLTQKTNYYTQDAKKEGIKPDKTGHMPSRIPSGENRGLYLKKVAHPTFYKSVQADLKRGYKLYKKGSRYYSFKDKDPKIKQMDKKVIQSSSVYKGR